MSDIALSRGVRSNLQSLQGIASMLTVSQERLATGKKVNSALDNPSAFFTARGMTDRANSTQSLLDSMSTAISTVKAANQSLETITTLLKQASSIAEESKKGGSYEARSVTGTSSIQGASGSGTIQQNSRNAALTSNGFTAGQAITFTTVNNGVTKAYTFTEGTDGTTVGQLVDGINASGVATAKINENGTLTFEARDVDTSFVISGAAWTDNTLGFAVANDANTALATPTTVAGDGVNYQAQFDEVIEQINNAAADAKFNGINLLAASNDLVVRFDADNSDSDITISSANMNASGLSVNNLTIDAANVDNAITALGTALTTVKAQQVDFGNKLSIIQTREDLGKSLTNILKTASDNLTLADQNEEAANVLALQTRQQLAQSALSLANQADQAVLQLLR